VYRPARLVAGAVDPLHWSGSSDLRGAAAGDGFAIFPAGERIYEKGEPVGFLPLRPRRSVGRSPY
jgi:molybdopterin biosynthesis enzyme